MFSSRTKVLMLLDEILWLIPKCQSKRSHRDSQTETVISILCWKGKGRVWYKLPVDTRGSQSQAVSVWSGELVRRGLATVAVRDCFCLGSSSDLTVLFFVFSLRGLQEVLTEQRSQVQSRGRGHIFILLAGCS